MGTADRILERMRSGAEIQFDELEILARAFGIEVRNHGGSHYKYCHPHLPRPVVIARHGKKLKRCHVEDFLAALEKIGAIEPE